MNDDLKTRLDDMERLARQAKARGAPQHMVDSYLGQAADLRAALNGEPPAAPVAPPALFRQGPGLLTQIAAGAAVGLVAGEILKSRRGAYLARSVVRGLVYRGVRAMTR